VAESTKDWALCTSELDTLNGPMSRECDKASDWFRKSAMVRGGMEIYSRLHKLRRMGADKTTEWSLRGAIRQDSVPPSPEFWQAAD
jgi:hypothetical protein